jgi:predicted nucleic acid-binding protein
MPDRVFIDTNILIYFISDRTEKKEMAKEAIYSASTVVVSSQVINEFISTCLKKNLLGLDAVTEVSNEFMRALEFCTIKPSTIDKALSIVKKYKYSYWDSLIAASALECDCSILYTEDMRNKQIIGNKLKIVNPFIERDGY